MDWHTGKDGKYCFLGFRRLKSAEQNRGQLFLKMAFHRTSKEIAHNVRGVARDDCFLRSLETLSDSERENIGQRFGTSGKPGVLRGF